MWKYVEIGVVALCLSLVASQALAQWNLADDFSTVNNPNPPWDVGTIGPDFSFNSYENAPYDFFFEDQVTGWGAWQSGAVTKNITGSDFVGWPGQHWHPEDGIFMMPTSSETGFQMGVAWTSPISGTVSVIGRFYGATVIDPQPAAVGPVRIVAGGSDIWNDSINGAVEGGGFPEVGTDPEAPFAMQVDVTVGDQIMFGFGNFTNWADYRFGLDLSIGNTLVGDMDFDEDVDFDDIDDFVLGLTDPLGYESIFGVPPSVPGDTDSDGDQDFDDIAGFVNILSGGGPLSTQVPEPSSLALLVLAGIIGTLVRCRRSDRR